MSEQEYAPKPYVNTTGVFQICRWYTNVQEVLTNEFWKVSAPNIHCIKLLSPLRS